MSEIVILKFYIRKDISKGSYRLYDSICVTFATYFARGGEIPPLSHHLFKKPGVSQKVKLYCLYFKVEITNCNKFIGLSISQVYLKYLCLKEYFKRTRYIGYSSTFLKVAESASKDA